VLAAVALAGVASAHGHAVAHKAEEAPYVAVLFAGLVVVATLVAAVLAAGRAGAGAWGLAGGLALGALGAYVVSRTLGLPELADHVGHWLDPAALVALACEGAVVGLWILRSRRAALAARRASALALPEPAVAWRAVAGAAAVVLVLVAGGGAVQDALAGGRLGAHAAGAHAHAHDGGAAGHAVAEGLLAAARVGEAGHAHAHAHAHADAGRAGAQVHAHPPGGRPAAEASRGGGEHARGHRRAGRGGAAEGHGGAKASGGGAKASGGGAKASGAGHRHAHPPARRGVQAGGPAAAGGGVAGGGAPPGAAGGGTAARHAGGGGHHHAPGDGAAGVRFHEELRVTAAGRVLLGRPLALRLGAASPAQRAAARALLDRARASAARLFSDVASARRRGYVMPRSAARARLVHLHHAGHAADRDLLDPARPESLVFLRRPGRPLRLVALMFRAPTGRPPAPSPLLRWHVHGACVDAGLRLRSGVTVPRAGCGAGRALHHGATMMLHLWLAADLRSALALDLPRALRTRTPALRAPAPPPVEPSAPRPDRVVRVLDGDTVELERLGVARLAGIDAPAPGAACAGAARDALASLLAPGDPVAVVWEAPREDADGRALVSLHRGTTDAAAVLVRRGLARPDADPVARHAARLDRLAAQARDAGRGLWGASPACA